MLMNVSGLVGEVGVGKKEHSRQRRWPVLRPRVEGPERSDEAVGGPCGQGAGGRGGASWSWVVAAEDEKRQKNSETAWGLAPVEAGA